MVRLEVRVFYNFLALSFLGDCSQRSDAGDPDSGVESSMIGWDFAPCAGPTVAVLMNVTPMENDAARMLIGGMPLAYAPKASVDKLKRLLAECQENPQRLYLIRTMRKEEYPCWQM